MRNIKDLYNLEPHDVVIDGVKFSFGDSGILQRPTGEQVRVVTDGPLRKQRFVEEEPQVKREDHGRRGKRRKNEAVVVPEDETPAPDHEAGDENSVQTVEGATE